MIREIKDQTEWDKLLTEQGGHPLQLWAWGELKQAHGSWTPYRLAIEQNHEFIGGAQILARKLSKPFGRMFYIPRGPFCAKNNRGEILQELTNWAKNRGGIELKIEPDWAEAEQWPAGWRRSKNRILVSQTAIIDLSRSQDEIMSRAAKKTRQYIRGSASAGVTVRRVTAKKDIAKCLEIYHSTAKRNKFGLHEDSYYYDLARLAGDSNLIYLAEKDGQPLSFLWNLRTPSTEFELYGGANEAGQGLRSNYCLKWHAITEAKAAQVAIYDLNGLLNDGVSNFKRSFSDDAITWVGTWDKPLSPLYYAVETALPVAKKTVQVLNRLKKR
ncbi:aminoacyltransferase [Candidatus Saccharibacteria bacterium]|nr:aminoacyltransferase [Candidatus Saccharibacteria bacterium]